MKRILFFCIAAAALCGAEARTWQCPSLNMWDRKTYELGKQDFCEKEWYNKLSNSQPTCDKRIAPFVTFYDEASTTAICKIDMSQGRGGNYHTCLAKVKANANQGTWIVYLAHGYTDNGKFYSPLRTAFSKRYGGGRKVIFAEVDWSYGSMGLNRGKSTLNAAKSILGFRNDPEQRLIAGLVPKISCSVAGAGAKYLEAASNTMVVGHLLGLLTVDIVNLKIPNLKTMCIGHSLGGHVCGFTGKTKQLDAIVGLDTAGPVFEENSSRKRLNKGDAKVVYSIHFNTANLGIKKAVGDYDIYVNGGAKQPDCLTTTCSHSKFTHGFMKEILTHGPCIFGKIVPALGDTSPGKYTLGRHDVSSTDKGCEFCLGKCYVKKAKKIFKNVKKNVKNVFKKLNPWNWGK